MWPVCACAHLEYDSSDLHASGLLGKVVPLLT